MDYIQLSIAATESEQEILVGQLNEWQATGFEQTDNYLLAYFDDENFPGYEIYEVLKKFAYTIHTVEEQNWNAAWEESFQPVVLTDFVAVRAHFHTPIQNIKHEVIITPKMSFGTGHHATTYLMLQQMQQLNFEGKHVLDFGTGTGILAILAEKLGAAQVTAIDNDVWSFENIQENLQLNHCAKIQALLGERIPNEMPYNIILANITRNILLSYMDVLKNCLVIDGFLLLSGFLEADKADMITAAQKRGMKVVREEVRAGWLSLLLVKPGKNKWA